MKLQLEAGVLTALLALSSAANAQDHNKEGASASPKYDFQFTIGQGARKRYVPIDCALLGKNGELTSAFLKQMGIWGHLDGLEKRMGENASEAQKIFAFSQHLRPHNISQDKIGKVVEHCKEHYL